MEMLENRQFIIDQRLLSVRNTYVVKDRSAQELGFIKQEFLSVGPNFWLEDLRGNHLGTINGKVVSVHAEYDIKDKEGQLKAKVKKKILKLFGSEWWMEDPRGQEIARINGNFVEHTYDILSPRREIIAKVHLNWVTIRDEYCIEIFSQDFDPLLVLGFAVAMDNIEHKERGKVKITI